jgi:hypothetical protein
MCLVTHRKCLLGAGTKENQFKGSIYMAFDYMDHDLTGLMERQNHKFTLPQVRKAILVAVLRASSSQLQPCLFRSVLG